jgi:hypothetical protein
MDEWWRQQVASGFEAFRGAHLSGSVPIRDTLINDLLREWLASAAAAPPAPPSKPPAPDAAALARLVRRATVTASDGVVTLDFELGV